MSKAKTLIPNLDNLSNMQLADIIGELDVITRNAAMCTRTLRKEWAKRGLTRVVGDEFEVLRSPVEQERVDIPSLRTALGDLINEFIVNSLTWRFTIRPSIVIAEREKEALADVED